jgi:hypothetical protein
MRSKRIEGIKKIIFLTGLTSQICVVINVAKR